MYMLIKITVVVVVLQVVTCITSSSVQNISSSAPPPLHKPNVVTNTTANNTLDASGNSKQVVVEGGGKIEMPAVEISLQHDREHVAKGFTAIVNSTVATSSTAPTSVAIPKVQSNSSSSTTNTTSNTTERYIPVDEKSLTPNNTSETTPHKKIAARKGVNLTDYLEHKMKPKKPTVTTSAENEPYNPSHFQSKSNLSATHSIPKVPNLDLLSENNEGNTQKYVVPIVIVILSVPFVAILISILYKRGSEWWKYRHYRRMDFLINGMYDN